MKEDGLCIVKYTPNSLGAEEVSLFIGSKDMSSEPFTVETSLENLKDATADTKANVIDSLMDSLVLFQH